MIVIQCPYCREERTEEELTYGGESEIIRPTSPEEVSDKTWTEYLYFRSNPKGKTHEQWCCSGGCGQWFKVARDTVSHEILQVVRYDGELTKETGIEQSHATAPSVAQLDLGDTTNELPLAQGDAQ